MEDMTSYSYDHNVENVSFEISCKIPQAVTIYEQVDLEWVKDKVSENPLLTLKQLSDLISKKFSLVPSLSYMDRILRLAGISRITGSRAKKVAA